jgi:hypothetical protein
MSDERREKIILATIPTGGNVAFDIDLAALHAAEQALEERQRQALEGPRTKPTTETPTRTVLGLLGARASGWF